jgi:RNA polymerase sigma factor (sigma-70 family)
MASHPLLDFIRRLRRARSVAEGGHLSDAQLLQRFAEERDEAAFEVLVWRHGAMVLNVAQRLLRQSIDAEDVFQATFLTLARKASAIRRGTSVGSWLYKVAYRLALRARQTAARRQRFEQPGIESASAPVENADAEVSAVLAEEVDRLPERYRAVVVLCYLQGATTEEASRLLGCPRGTVLSRLASARQRLRQRLIRRGIAPAAALAAVSFNETVSAAPAVALVACAVRAALPFAAGGAAVPIVSPQAAALAEGVLQMMMWNKIKIVAVTVCVIALVGTGSGWLARGRNAVEAPLPAAEPPAKKEGLPAAAPDPAEKLITQIARIHNQLDQLAEKENEWEETMIEKLIDVQVRLAEARDVVGAPRGNPDELRNARKQLYRAEYELERIQTRRARTREEFAVKRRALLARLEQLEGQSLGLEPSDRVRDVERKLDALRREVGELRRTLERQGKDAQK